jgi:ABC-type glycerol-3-phosphate transport system substrate-binding protein
MRSTKTWARLGTGTAAVAVAALALTGCAPAADDGKTEIVLWDAHGPLFKDAIAPVLEAFEADNPDVTVTIQTVDWDTFQQRVLSSAAANQLPCVMYSNTQVVAAIAAAGVMQPVDTDIITQDQLDQYLPAFKDGLSSVDGELLFVPFLGGANQFYIRVPEGGGATIPTTYSEWIDWADANTTRDGDTLSVAGLGWRYDVPGNSWLTSEFQALTLAAGGEFLNNGNGPEADTAEFNTAAGAQALQFMHDTVWKDKVAFAPNQINQGDNAIGNFVNGVEQSSYLGPWLPNAVATLEGAAASFKGTWDSAYVTPMPDSGGTPVSILSYDGWGVPKTCEHPDEAWEFIKYMTSAESMATFFEVFQHPVTRTDAMLSDQVAQVIAENMGGATHFLDLWTNPEIAAGAVTEVRHRFNAEIYNVVTSGIIDYLNDPNADTQAALDKLEAAVNTALNG